MKCNHGFPGSSQYDNTASTVRKCHQETTRWHTLPPAAPAWPACHFTCFSDAAYNTRQILILDLLSPAAARSRQPHSMNRPFVLFPTRVALVWTR